MARRQDRDVEIECRAGSQSHEVLVASLAELAGLERRKEGEAGKRVAVGVGCALLGGRGLSLSVESEIGNWLSLVRASQPRSLAHHTTPPLQPSPLNTVSVAEAHTVSGWPSPLIRLFRLSLWLRGLNAHTRDTVIRTAPSP